MNLGAAAAAAPVTRMHIGIIMDGNGRWARRRRLPRFFGHRAGAERIEEMVRACGDHPEIRQLTLYTFSTENWQRPTKEVDYIFNLLVEKIRSNTPDLLARGIRVRFLGDRTTLPGPVRELMAENERATAGGTSLDLSFCINYGARDEIVRACRAAAADIAAGRLAPGALTPETFAGYLDTAGLSPVDLVIRTSGEQRLSNFLLFQAAYAEFYFTPVLWPDFSARELARALEEFGRRRRRFGGIKA